MFRVYIKGHKPEDFDSLTACLMYIGLMLVVWGEETLTRFPLSQAEVFSFETGKQVC